MIQSWKFINGEKIMFPTTWREAEESGWFKVPLRDVSLVIDYWVNGNEEVNNWLKENIADRAYWLSTNGVYFYRESDAIMFTLRWS